MNIDLNDGVHVFATLAPGTTIDVEPVASIVEREGRTVVLPEADALRLGLAATYRCAWITLRAYTALDGVGLLARVTAALAARGISVNPVAGFHHDHLFVSVERAGDAMEVLAGLPEGSTRVVVGEYETDDDPGRVDRDAVWAFLSTEAYWNGSRTRAGFEAQLAASRRQVGAYRRDTGELVGFARAVTDDVTFGYLADVFVLRSARGAGLGKALVEAMLDGPGRIRWVLFTDDAHDLYTRYGFAPPGDTCLVRRPVTASAAGVRPPGNAT
ncbi:ACT domain-containing protein [Pseudonocardia abyssalis]|nr:ACT domain-containing protein [Pseudonocardia abyssalis]